MADVIFTLKIVVALLIVAGLILGVLAILLFSRSVTLSRGHKIFIGALLAAVNLILLAVGYAAFFAKLR